MSMGPRYSQMVLRDLEGFRKPHLRREAIPRVLETMLEHVKTSNIEWKKIQNIPSVSNQCVV